MANSNAHDVRSVTATIERLRSEHEPAHGVGWDFDGFRVWLDSNEPALLRTLSKYFSDFRRLDANN